MINSSAKYTPTIGEALPANVRQAVRDLSASFPHADDISALHTQVMGAPGHLVEARVNGKFLGDYFVQD